MVDQKGQARQGRRDANMTWSDVQELLISPNKLRGANIPFTRMVQHAGEMVINFPGAYHSGFNSGKRLANSQE